VALLVGFIVVSDLEHVGDHFRALGWTAPWVLLPYVVINVLDTLGWRCTLGPDGRGRVPFASLYLVRMAGEAVNSVTPTATVGGEPVKAHLLRGFGVRGTEGVASVVLARTALVVSQAIFVALGTAALLAYLGRPLAATLWLVALLVMVALFALGLVRLQQRGLTAASWRLASRVAPRSRLVARLEHAAAAIDDRLHSFYAAERTAFAQATALHLAAWAMGACEIQLMMWMIGAPVSFLEAFVIESLAQVIRAAAVVIPGGLGAQEWGGMWLCTTLGMAEPHAVTLWLLKRGREIVFDLVGLGYLAKRVYRGRAP
jgi:putative membrane protein